MESWGVFFRIRLNLSLITVWVFWLRSLFVGFLSLGHFRVLYWILITFPWLSSVSLVVLCVCGVSWCFGRNPPTPWRHQGARAEEGCEQEGHSHGILWAASGRQRQGKAQGSKARQCPYAFNALAYASQLRIRKPRRLSLAIACAPVAHKNDQRLCLRRSLALPCASCKNGGDNQSMKPTTNCF